MLDSHQVLENWSYHLKREELFELIMITKLTLSTMTFTTKNPLRGFDVKSMLFKGDCQMNHLDCLIIIAIKLT